MVWFDPKKHTDFDILISIYGTLGKNHITLLNGVWEILEMHERENGRCDAWCICDGKQK